MKKMRLLYKTLDNPPSSNGQMLAPLLLLVLSCFNLLPSVSNASSWNLEETLKTYVKSAYPWPEITISDIIVKGDIPDIKPSRIIVQRGLPGRTVFSLEFASSETVIVTANVRAFDNVIAVRRAFKKGYVLQKDDLYATYMDVQRIPAGSLRDIKNVSGKALNRSVLANTPVTTGMLSESSEVKRGKKVTLLVEAESFRISTSGEIRENGSIGNYVKALNLASKKTVTGLLVDENTVKVEL